jgi:DNA-binding protein H-NS
MDERKRESIAAYLRRRMIEFDISPEDLAASIAAE